MLREERLQYIMQKLQKNNRVSSTQLSQELSVSDDTIRRDLNELENGGFLKKVHGGAIPKPVTPRPYQDRMNFAQKSKAILARKSLPLFKDGQVVILDGGTTNYHVSTMLPPELKATIFTNSLPIGLQLSDHPNIELRMLGGVVDKGSKVTVGNSVLKTLDQIRPDLCVVGTCSVHPELGVTIPEYEEAQVKNKMIEMSAKSVILATQEKLNTAMNYLVCKYDQLDTLVIEDDLDEEILSLYQGKGVELF